ncbi:Lrp/AsnC ligand binding domain-containing protein [Candidatus Woesearchaeota archaeon]|nr:Lrp/AsnC ligand binding domain-containing protein [Candidatus Woesearchaeota archaeon]
MVPVLAYIQISLDSAQENRIYESLKAMKGVKDVHVLFGEWDMLVKLETHSPEDLAAFVMDNIRSLPGVKLTSTMIVAR